MEDTFIVRSICEHFGLDTPEDEDKFVTDSELTEMCLHELVHMGYTVEIGFMPPYTYSVVARKWLPPEDEDEDSFEYAFSSDEFLSRGAMTVLIKVLGP